MTEGELTRYHLYASNPRRVDLGEYETQAQYRAHPVTAYYNFGVPLQAVFDMTCSPLFSKQGLSVQQNQTYLCSSLRLLARLYKINYSLSTYIYPQPRAVPRRLQA